MLAGRYLAVNEKPRRPEEDGMRRDRPNLWLLLSALSLTVVSTVNVAAAQPANEQAEKLFREGRDAMTRGDYATACPKFAESVRLTRRPGPLLNLAQCEEHEGQLKSALTHWREGIALLPAGDERIGVSTERATALEQRIPRLTVKLAAPAPAASKVTVDGAELNASSIGTAVMLEPGEHTIVVTAPGYTDARSTVTLAEKERREITMAPGSEHASKSSSGGPAPPASGASSPSSRGRWVAGFVVGGIGLASLAAGGATGVLALVKNNEKNKNCPNNKCPTADAKDAGERARKAAVMFGTISTITLAVGGAGVVTGVVLLVTSPSKNPPASTAVALTAVPGFAGFTVRGRF
jgi:hypothetical protein